MRAIVITLFVSLGLAGCQTFNQSDPGTDLARCQVFKYCDQEPLPDLSNWLEVLEEYQQMELEQAEQELKTYSRPVEESFALYRYGLVNQQLGDRLGWIRARDSFRELVERPLSPQLLPLVNLLLEYNQKMINADARNSRLIQAVSSTDEQMRALEQELVSQQQSVIKLQQQLEDLKAVEEAISHKRADPLQGVTESE